jgi:hypothetical protein
MEGARFGKRVMEGAGAFIYGILIFNFAMPVLIPLFFLIRLWRFLRLKIVYLLTAVALCYVSGLVLVLAVHFAESSLEGFAGSFDPALIGFIVQNILVVFLYMYVSWLVSRFFRSRNGGKLL